MNLLEAAATIASTSDIDVLFALYSQSRAYKNGGQIRNLIEARTKEIASLNDYEDDFASFRDLVEFHDNETSPLWQFARIDNVIATRNGYPIPYSLEDFIHFFKKTYDIGMFVYVEEGDEQVPYSKYVIIKVEDKIYFSDEFENEYEIGKDVIPQEMVDEIFQPSVSFRVWDGSFSKGDFYLTIDLLIDGSTAVYNNFDDTGGLIRFGHRQGDKKFFTKKLWAETMSDFSSNDYLFETEEKTLTLVSKIYTTHGVYSYIYDDLRIDKEVVYDPFFKMFDPTPYRYYPRALRYAIYSLLAAPFLAQMYESDRNFLEKFFRARKEYALPLLEESYGTYYNPKEDGWVYLATHIQLTGKEMQSITDKYGAITYLDEYTDGVHCYKIAILAPEI